MWDTCSNLTFSQSLCAAAFDHVCYLFKFLEFNAFLKCQLNHCQCIKKWRKKIKKKKNSETQLDSKYW